MNDIKFWKFWTIVILLIAALLIGQTYFGLFDFILANDQTMISFINFSILGLSQMLIGWKYYTKNYNSNAFIYNLSDTAVTLGLMGTLIGFMFVLWAVFGPGVVLDPTNTVMMTQALAEMAKGMAAALITSLTGLSTMLIINFQLVILEK